MKKGQGHRAGEKVPCIVCKYIDNIGLEGLLELPQFQKNNYDEKAKEEALNDIKGDLIRSLSRSIDNTNMSFKELAPATKEELITCGFLSTIRDYNHTFHVLELYQDLLFTIIEANKSKNKEDLKNSIYEAMFTVKHLENITPYANIRKLRNK